MLLDAQGNPIISKEVQELMRQNEIASMPACVMAESGQRKEPISGLILTYHAPFFPPYTHPNGHLPQDKGAQALFYYALLARFMQEAERGEMIEYEDEVSPQKKYREVFTSVMLQYCIDDGMPLLKFWPFVDQQMEALNMPLLEGVARFDEAVEIKG